MMLKDKQGHTVVLHAIRFNREDHTHSYRTGWEFLTIDGLKLTKVDEAIVSAGNDIFLSLELVRSLMGAADLADVKFTVSYADDTRYSGPVSFGMVSDGPEYSFLNWSRGSVKRIYKLNGNVITLEKFNKLLQTLTEINDYAGLHTGYVYSLEALGKGTFRVSTLLEMIGEGKTVTVESLMKCQAKDETRPRLIIGDSVKVKVKGKEALGVIKSISPSSKVTVVRQDGVKMSCDCHKVERTDEVGYNNDFADRVDLTLRENFEQVLKESEKRLYRAKLEKTNFTFPMFAGEDEYGHMEKQTSYEDVMCCVCPACGWRMSDIKHNGTYECCYCRIIGMVIKQDASEVVLLMNRMPGKNRFAIKEARCCANCGNFDFEVGRQGKRSTGYCRTSNQCLQAFNVCNLWYPRPLSRYESNMRQHVTNLHYGVKDRRNTKRNDIKDTIYTEADHKLEIARADAAKLDYANAYQKFLADMRALAEHTPMGDTLTLEHWQKVLDDPC